MCVYERGRERPAGSFHGQEFDDQRVVEDLGLGSLVYGWRQRRPPEPLPFQMGHHVWELYQLPEEASGVATTTLARTSRRHIHWLLDWPGRDRVLLRRPSCMDLPAISKWTRPGTNREHRQRLAASAATVARLDETLESVEVLEPLYVERAHLQDRDWRRTVALLADGEHIAVCPWDWYDFIVSDFVASCSAAVRLEQKH